MKLKPAPAVAAVAASLIAKHHQALMGVEVVYLFCDKPLTEHGRPAVAVHNRAMGRELFWMQTATAQTYFEGAKTGNGLLPDSAEDKQAEEDGFDNPRGMFVVTVWEKGWESLEGDLQRAVVDHELCHLGVESTKEGYRRVLKPHDVEEFQAIIDRHGPYTEALKKVLKVAVTGQPELEVEEGGADKPKKKAGGG
jgi:hypothetical protein